MSILWEAGKQLLNPSVAKAAERFASKPEEGSSRIGRLGKDVLRATFPGVYAITDAFSSGKKKKDKTKKRDKQSPVTEAVTNLSAEVVQTNSILAASVETQTEQNIVLEEILKSLKGGGGSGGKPGIDMPDIPGIGGKGKGNKPGAGGKGKGGKGAKGKPTVGRDKSGKFTKIKPTIGSKIATGAGNALKAGGRLVSGAPVVGGIISGGIEYAQTGNAGKAVSVGAGSAVGAGIGTALGTGAGALLGGVGAVPLGWLGGVLGGMAGGALGGLAYDMFGDNKKDKKEQKFEAQSINYKAELIKFKSNTMSIKTREFTIKGILGGGGLSSILPGVVPGDSTDREQAINGPGGVGDRLRGRPTPSGNRVRLMTSGANGTKPRAYEVDSKYANNFKGFVDELEKAGYVIKEIGGYRPSAMQHGQGLAIDINPSDNPMVERVGGIYQRWDQPGKPVDDSYQNSKYRFGWGKDNFGSIDVSAMARKWGLGWGGDWKSKTDTMHFSVGGGEGGSGEIASEGQGTAQTPTANLASGDNRKGETKPDKLEQYAEGTNFVPKKGPAVVGEKGKETVVRGDKKLTTPSKPSVVELERGDKVIPAEKPGVLGSFFKELTSPLTGETTNDKEFIGNTTREVMEGDLSQETVGKFGARALKGFSPVGVDNLGNAIRKGAGGDVGGMFKESVRALPFGNFLMDAAEENRPQEAPAPPPSPTPTPAKQQRSQPSINTQPNEGQAPAKKMKKAEADTGQDDQYNSTQMLRAMFGAAA